ncbi:uncharacterized protein LOC130695965 [Daphnia carinata]|uniref:uncharacterized protein LOC130695965 n=1 Tax=Daphnia carinata TaxID=120202 RepID=UPI00257D7660|nr:uncharacterized protein LOC130695965 [Daphnia carinata]
MSKSPNLKPKRTGKLAGKPFKVALSFSKKSPYKLPQESEVGDASSHKILGIRSISPKSIGKTPPLYSSTPKPTRNAVPIPVSFSGVPCQQKSGQQHLTKNLVVVLERIKIQDYISAEARLGKPLNQSVLTKQKQEKKKSSVLLQDESAFVTPQEASKNNGRKETPLKGSDGSILTTIPSEALESFGLLNRQPRLSTPKRSPTKSDNSVIIETPPRTSTACSSVDDQSLTHDGVSSDNCEPPNYLGNVPSTTDLDVAEAILLQSSAHDTDRLLDASSSSQDDPLETAPQPPTIHTLGSIMEQDHVSSHCDYLYGLNERVYSKPDSFQLSELHFSNSDVRRIAPYSLKLHEEKFFQYVAPVSKIGEKYCCIVFGVMDHYIVAYSGHFVVDKGHLYDPIKKIPVDDVKITDFNLCRQHLVLLNVANKKLFQMENYYPKARHPSYCETQLASSEMLMFSINQVQLKERVRSDIALEQLKAQIMVLPELKDANLKQSCAFPIPIQGSHQITSFISEPRTEQVFFETCLPINQNSLERILDNLKPVGDVKTNYNDLGSLQLRCATEAEYFTIYYAAYEEPGCTSFYRNVFLLGYVDKHYIVGVVAGNSFFIMATKRLYSRICLPSPGMQPVKFRTEMLDMIHLPLWLPYKQSIVMLEARQIFRHSSKYQYEYQDIMQSMKISEFESPTSNLANETQLLTRHHHSSWLEKMLDMNFSWSFRNSPSEFPIHPSSSKNPLLLCESVTKLWLHHLMRNIHVIRDSSLHHINPSEASLTDFFTLTISSFISSFLPLFGMSNESNFQCLRLGPDGIPSAVCMTSLPAHEIGFHIHQCHTQPLLWDNTPHKNFTFVPFSLVFAQRESPPLSDTCDFNRLAWARSLVERWCKGSSLSYLDFLQTLENSDGKKSVNVPTMVGRGRPKKRGIGRDEVAHQRVPQKRKRKSNDSNHLSSKRVLRSSDSDSNVSD